jgi:hypothetical protein
MVHKHTDRKTNSSDLYTNILMEAMIYIFFTKKKRESRVDCFVNFLIIIIIIFISHKSIQLQPGCGNGPPIHIQIKHT